MAFAIPTTPATTLLTYAEMDSQFTDVCGESAGLIGTTLGQRLAEAAEGAYGDIVDCLLKHGYTPAKITLWFATSIGHATHLWLAAYYWLTISGVSRDSGVWDRAERHRRDWLAICESGGPIFDVTGALIVPNPDLLGVGLQARASVQNNSLGKRHLFRCDADPRQHLAGSASMIVGGTHYDNPVAT